MEVHQERKSVPKENALSSSAFLEKDEDQNNYVFIDEKYKKYFDNISDIFEDKVEYVLNKHFKKNDPTNKNKLLCLNLCVLWQKKFLLLLSKTLNEYEEFKQKNNLNNEKGKNEGEISEKKKETVLKEKDSKEDNNIINRTTVMNTNTINTNTNNTSTTTTNDNTTSTTATTTTTTTNNNNNSNNNNDITTTSTSTETGTSTGVSAEKDLKSFIKNVKIIDNKNIEVVYDPSEINDNRPSAELSTEEIYYLLVESKKSENEYKKKIFTFLQYLPLIIQSMETKNYLEKKNLEQKLLFTEFNDMNAFQHNGQNKHETHLNHQNMDVENSNNTNVNVNVNVMNMNNVNNVNNMNNVNNVNNVNNMNNVNNVNNMNNMNPMNGIDNFGIPMNNVPNDPVNGNEDENRNININGTDGFQLSEEEITNKLNAIVNFNYSLSGNLEKLFKYELNNNKKKYKKENINMSNNNENEHEKNDNNNNANNNNNNKTNRNNLFKNPLGNTENNNNNNNNNNMFASSANCQNEDENSHNLKSLVLPLSRVNDISMINNISAKTNNITYEDVNENENEYLFYIYKNNMDKTNLYGLDILTNLNNKVLCKINHIYSLVQFYTMLAKDLFDDV